MSRRLRISLLGMEKIGDYGLIGDLHTAALVSRTGNLGWLCWPEFDSEACFASLLGDERNGQWSLAPGSFSSVSQQYLPGTLVLETRYRRLLGEATVTDFMPVRDRHSAVVRIVRGVRGRVRMETKLAARFDYGSAKPYVSQVEDDTWTAIYGPQRLTVRSPVPLHVVEGDLAAEWTISAGQTHAFILQRSESFADPGPRPFDAEQSQTATVGFWRDWTARSRYRGPYREQVERSLITLKALTNAPSGGFLAAPTTSLPEKPGGIRNWDYRYCWIRDTSFSVRGMMECGYEEEASAWMQWLSRSVQGDPAALKIVYGISGKREHSEWEAEWLPGYLGSKPIHIGNKAASQRQLGVFGLALEALYCARKHNIYPHEDKSGRSLEVPLLERLEQIWREPDVGLWEFRTEPRQFTESKALAWVAFDRGVRMAEEFGVEGPVERWRSIREKIHSDVCRHGFQRRLNSFTQTYGNLLLDASLLLLPMMGFLPADDPRIQGTVRAVERRLIKHGLLYRYDTHKVKDSMPPGEGAFLASNFWLVCVYVMQGRHTEARQLFERLLTLANPLGLLSEEYDPKHGLVGNYPQAFSHIALIHAAVALDRQGH